MATEKRVNHVAAVRCIEDKLMATGTVTADDVRYLIDRVRALRDQLGAAHDREGLAAGADWRS